MTHIKVSIIIPVFNAEKYLPECLDSLLQQTLTDIEIICVDDSSLDNSLRILKQYAVQDNRIIILKQQNRGAGAARNHGLEHATGKYVYFMDADDYCDINLLKETYEKAEADQVDIVVFDFCRFDEINGTVTNYDGMNRNALPKNKDIFSYLDAPDKICSIVNPTPWNKLFKREFLISNNLKYLTLSTTNDITFATLSVIKARSFSYINKVFYHYRIGLAGSITQKKRNNLDNIIIAALTVYKEAQQLPYYKVIENSVRKFVIDNLFVGLDRYAGDKDTQKYLEYYNKMGAIFCSHPLFLGNIEFEKINLKLAPRVIECQSFAISQNNYSYLPKIIVSLTTYPKRIPTIYKVIACLFRQTYKPDKIILWLSEEQFPNKENDIPWELQEYVDKGLEIRFCEDDLRSHKKYLYAMKEFPEDIVITVDDDLLYPNNMVEMLVKSYRSYPHAVSAMRTHLMCIERNGEISLYSEWVKEYPNIVNTPCMQLLATSGAGTLFPPHSLDEQVFNTEAIKKLAYNADDLWLKIMQVIKGTPVVLVQKRQELHYIEGTQDQTLWKTNINENDIQLDNILTYCSSELGICKQFLLNCIFIDNVTLYNEALKFQLDEVKKRNAIIIEDRKKLQIKFDESTKQKNTLQTKLNENMKQKNALQAKLDENTRQKNTLQTKLDESTKQKNILQAKVNESIKQKNTLQAKVVNATASMNAMQNSYSFKIGRIITYIPRKIRGGVRCYQSHGLLYTIKRTIEHFGIDMGTGDLKK